MAELYWYEGFQQGFQQDFAKGQKHKSREVALKLLKIGIDLTTVDEVTALSIKELKELQKISSNLLL